MISISFNLDELPLAQVLDSAKQLLRQSTESHARVAIKQQAVGTVYFVDMHKFVDGKIQETLWDSHTAAQEAKHNDPQGVDTAPDQG